MAGPLESDPLATSLARPLRALAPDALNPARRASLHSALPLHGEKPGADFGFLLLVVGALACAADPIHDLGYTSTDRASESVAPPVAQSAADFEGVWIGRADDPFALQPNADDAPPLFHFPSGSTRIRLELIVPSDDASMLVGVLTFGEAPPPPPATDPDVGYPVQPDQSLDVLVYDRGYPPPVEGFAYQFAPVVDRRDLAAADPTLTAPVDYAIDGKLQGVFFPNQLFESWCALQTAESCPAVEGTDDFGCFFGEEDRAGACLKRMQCLTPVCSCPSEGACTWSSDAISLLVIRLSDDGLVGLFQGADFVNERGFRQPIGTVHFVSQSTANP